MKKLVKHCFDVWCAVHYSQIVGPYFFEEPTVTGADYLEMLRTIAILQVRQIPNNEEFQQNGALHHQGRFKVVGGPGPSLWWGAPRINFLVRVK